MTNVPRPAGPGWAAPRMLAIVGLCGTLVLWTAWVIFIAVTQAPIDFRDPAVWLLGLAFTALVGWAPLFATGLLMRLVRHDDMSDVGTYGAFLVLFGVPATFIACPLLLPGIVLVAASMWHHWRLRRAIESSGS